MQVVFASLKCILLESVDMESSITIQRKPTKGLLMSILCILVKPRHQCNFTVRSKLTYISEPSISFDGAFTPHASSGAVSHKILASPLLSLLSSQTFAPHCLSLFPPLDLLSEAPSPVRSSHGEATPSTAPLLLTMFTSVLNSSKD
jgi:hypothetical protein